MQFVEHDAPQRAEQDTARRREARSSASCSGVVSRISRRIAALALCASTPACRRCGSRSGSAAPSRRPAFRGCARCRPRAPSAARCRACAARPRGAVAAGGDQLARVGRRQLVGKACAAAPCETLALNSTSSAEIPPASCRRRSARSAAPSGRRAPSPAVRAGARAAPSRAARTSARTARAASWLRGVRERSPARGNAADRWRRSRPVSPPPPPARAPGCSSSVRVRDRPQADAIVEPGRRQRGPDMLLAVGVAQVSRRSTPSPSWVSTVKANSPPVVEHARHRASERREVGAIDAARRRR